MNKYKMTCIVSEEAIPVIMAALNGEATHFEFEPIQPAAQRVATALADAVRQFDHGQDGGARKKKNGKSRHRFVHKEENPAAYFVFKIWREAPDRKWRAVEFTRRLMAMGYGESTGPSVVSNSSKVDLAILHPTGEYSLTELGKTLSIDECVDRIRKLRLYKRK